MRVGAGAPGRVGHVDGGEQFGGGAQPFPAAHPAPVGERLGDLVGDPDHRVERGHRVLVDHGHAGAEEFGAPARGGGEQVLAVEQDLPGGGGPGGAGVDAEHGAGQYGLAGAGLADHAEALPGVDAEVDAVQDVQGAAVGGVQGGVQRADFQDRAGHPRPPFERSCSPR